MDITHIAGSAAAAAATPMRTFRGVARALDGPDRTPGRWRHFTPIDVGRAAVAAELTRFGLTAAEAALVVLSLGDNLAGCRIQISKNPKDGRVIDRLPPWPTRLCAVVVDVGAIATGAVARLPVQEPSGP